MPFLNSVRASFGAQGKFNRLPGNNGLTASTAFTTKQEVQSVSTNGLYYIKTSGMSQARQFYIDSNNTGGPTGIKWVRIQLPSKYYYTLQETELDSWANSDIPALIDSFSYFMYAFVDTTNNLRTQSWYFPKPSDSNFRNLPPTAHGGEASPIITLIDATQMSSGSTYSRYLRTGASSFGGYCDDSRSGYWGQICLKVSGPGIVSGPNSGFSDFPIYASFSIGWVNNNINNNGYGDTDCSRSDQQYNVTKCSATRNFAVYIG